MHFKVNDADDFSAVHAKLADFPAYDPDDPEGTAVASEKAVGTRLIMDADVIVGFELPTSSLLSLSRAERGMQVRL